MENQHRMIKGYRDLSEEEIALMNKIKELGANLEQFIVGLERFQVSNGIHFYKLSDHLMVDHDWLQQGKKYMQLGLMCITRSIAKPESF